MSPPLFHNLRSFLSDRTRLGQSARAFVGTVLLASFILTGVVVALRQFGALEEMELDAYDRFMRSRPDEGPDSRILVVGISEEDIQRRKEYPIYDGTLADVLAKLLTYQPRAIGIDIARDVPQGPPAGRARMIQVLKQSDRLFAGCLLSSADQPGVPGAPGTPSDRIGFTDLPQDPGGVVRRSILVSTPAPPPVLIGTPHLCNYAKPDNQVLSLSFLLATVYLKPMHIEPAQTEGGHIQLGPVVFSPLTENAGGYHSTGATDYQTMLNYRSASNSVRQVTLTKVLQGQVDPSWIKDRIVLIGYTSQVAKDSFATPYLVTQESTRSMPGVVIHAQTTSQILSSVIDKRPLIWYWTKGGEILWIWGWSLVGGLLAFYVRRTWKFILLGGIALVVCYGLPYLMFLQGGWLPVVPSTIALVITAVSVGFIDRATKGGYTQAIYEQLREQLQSGFSPAERQQNARRVDYLEDLVRRARAIRQQQEPGEVSDSQPIEEVAPPKAVLTSNFESKQTEALYQQIREQVENDLLREQKADETPTSQLLSAHTKEKRLQNLLQRSRMARNYQNKSLEEQQDAATSPPPETIQPDNETDTVE
ncbi:MAG TPA: CHASE2 domain-containing protein [Allocoleopsis sp.]